MKEIRSAGNPDYKLFSKLLASRKYRKETASYLMEGENGLEIPAELVRAYLLPSSVRDKLEQRGLPAEKVILLEDALFRNLSLDPASQGIITWAKCQAPQPFQPQPGIYLGLDEIQDPGNLGTIIRSAEAAGVNAVFCGNGTADIYHPKTLKAAASSISRVSLYAEQDLREVLLQLRAAGIRSYATSVTEAVPYDEAELSAGGFFLIGNEGRGLCREYADLADVRLNIPMSGKIESLNAAIATSILLFEAKRQRKLSTGIVD